MGELGAFARHVVMDHLKFASDIVEDAQDPGRRAGEQQAGEVNDPSRRRRRPPAGSGVPNTFSVGPVDRGIVGFPQVVA